MKQTNRIFFIVLAILLPLLCGGSVFFLTRNVPAACIVLGLSALQVLFTAWQRHREQAYWRSVAAQLSDLCDCLLSLEHREIFPRNEDTVLSKLQDKVLKLVTILQQKNELILCSSDGTKYENIIHDMAEIEVDATHKFAKTMEQLGYPKYNVDKTLEHILASGLFSAFFEVIIHDIPHENAAEYLEELKAFYTAGWKKIMGF